jgi:O-acetyl-ADP-ribose deacetylase (regulator of RNase III)
MAETREKYPQGCPTGEAVITGAGQLPARYVIHTVGPIWRGGKQGEPDLLTSAYRRSLEVAVDHHCQSVAFPSLSTGAYGYPLDLAARIALRTVMAFLQERQQPAWVRFVLFDQGTLDTFVQMLTGLQATQEA